MEVIEFTGSAVEFYEIAVSWKKEANGDTFGIQIDVPSFLVEIQRMVNSPMAGVLAMTDEDRIIGFMGLQIFRSPLGEQMMANEHFWYVLPDDRGLGSMRLMKAAKQWAKDHGCSHLLLNASALAGDKCDKVAQLYEKMKMKLFEHTYIAEV